jgi:hypothetical protein
MRRTILWKRTDGEHESIDFFIKGAGSDPLR